MLVGSSYELSFNNLFSYLGTVFPFTQVIQVIQVTQVYLISSISVPANFVEPILYLYLLYQFCIFSIFAASSKTTFKSVFGAFINLWL